MPRIMAAWLRCYVMVNVVYFLTGGLWAYYVYVCWGDKFFSPGNMPARKDMWEQIKVGHPLGEQGTPFGLPIGVALWLVHGLSRLYISMLLAWAGYSCRGSYSHHADKGRATDQEINVAGCCAITAC